MQEKIQARTDLLLLLSLLLLIVMYPMLDHGEIRRAILGLLLFVPLILATIKMSQTKLLVWPTILLMAGSAGFRVVADLFHNLTFAALQWITVAAVFGLIVFGLFSYLKSAHIITNAHLYTAASIYLLIGMQWFALYSAIDVVFPGSFAYSVSREAPRQSDLLYFSLVTLSTIGYGDILPLHTEVRMLAALEGVVGVLYVAITVALIVSAFKRNSSA
jgi:hypothetical protein